MAWNTITLFGEEKRICEWANDPRCPVDAKSISTRLCKGWNVEDAVLRPPTNSTIAGDKKIEDHMNDDKFVNWLKDRPNATRAQKLNYISYIDTIESRRLSSQKYAKNHREIKNAYQRKWRKANPLKRANHENTYRGSRRHPDAISSAELERLRIEHGDRCCYCGNVRKLTVEHIVPLSKGGTHTGDNILFACRPCNSSKFNKDLIIWMATGEHRGVWCFN